MIVGDLENSVYEVAENVGQFFRGKIKTLAAKKGLKQYSNIYVYKVEHIWEIPKSNELVQK